MMKNYAYKSLLLVAAVLFMAGAGCMQVESDEIGVQVRNFPPVNGVIEKTMGTGLNFHIPYLYDFYKLPRKHITIEMMEAGTIEFKSAGKAVSAAKVVTEENGSPDTAAEQMEKVKRELQEVEQIQIVVHDIRKGNENVRIKTADGNDAWVDAVVVFRVNPDKAYLAVEKVGYDEQALIDFTAAMIRGSLRSWLSELDSASILRPTDREQKIADNMVNLNKIMEEFGLEIVKISAPKVTIHPAYESILSKKRLAEEEKEEYVAYQLRAEQEKETKVNKARGEADAMIELANGRLLRAQKEGDATLQAKTHEAEANKILYDETAKGIAAQTDKLTGAGGDAQVALAIAQAITGKPIYIVPGNNGAFNTLDLNEFIQTYGALKAVTETAATPADLSNAKQQGMIPEAPPAEAPKK